MTDIEKQNISDGDERLPRDEFLPEKSDLMGLKKEILHPHLERETNITSIEDSPHIDDDIVNIEELHNQKDTFLGSLEKQAVDLVFPGNKEANRGRKNSIDRVDRLVNSSLKWLSL